MNDPRMGSLLHDIWRLSTPPWQGYTCDFALIAKIAIIAVVFMLVLSRNINVKKIGMRATVLQAFDLSEVIIPNSELINNQITNWTLSNRQSRVTIPVGVDYASDVSLVVETLLACAKEHDRIMKSPNPEVMFVNLGESSLDFELRVWIHDSDDRLLIKSQLYHEIVRRFREKEIVIPFPQRDLHLTSRQSLESATTPSGTC